MSQTRCPHGEEQTTRPVGGSRVLLGGFQRGGVATGRLKNVAHDGCVLRGGMFVRPDVSLFASNHLSRNVGLLAVEETKRRNWWLCEGR